MNEEQPVPPAPIVRAPQRLRIARCRRKLSIPANTDEPIDAVFQCELDIHPHDVPHMARGIVHLRNGTARDFTVTWVDLGFRTLHRRGLA